MKRIACMAIMLVLFFGIQAYGAKSAKLAVAAVDKTVTAAVSKQAGTAPYFLFFDKKGKFLEATENPYRNSESPGPSVINYVAGKGATVLVAGGFGPKIVDIAKGKGVTTVSFNGSVQDAVKKALKSK